MDDMVLVWSMVGSVGGGALGAWLAGAPVWKGALLTLIASILQIVVGELAGIEQPLVSSLVYLLAAGLVGGRWGLGLTGRQMSLVVIGSFLTALVVVMVVAQLGFFVGL